MRLRRIPGFTAEESLYGSDFYVQTGSMLSSSRQHTEECVQPAMKRRVFCGMKVCCYDLRDFGMGFPCFDRETHEPV